MRTFEEIQLDVKQAMSINDTAALELYAAELDDLRIPIAEALSNNARGVVAWLNGDNTLALGHYGRAQTLYRDLANQQGLAAVMSNIGQVHLHTGRYTTARENHHTALALYEELGDSEGIARATNNIGIVQLNIGNYPESLEQWNRSLALYEHLGNRTGVANVTNNIGNVHERTGDFAVALEHYHHALALHLEVGNRLGVANATGNIGLIHKNTADYPAALEYYTRAADLHEELGDLNGLARVIGNIGNVHSHTGNHSVALEYYKRALALHEEMGDRDGVAIDTGNIGNVHEQNGDYPAALEHYRRATALIELNGDHSGITRAMDAIVSVLIKMNSVAEVHDLMTRLDGMQIDDIAVRISCQINRATLLELSGDLDGAAVTLQRALAEALEHGLRSNAAEVHKLLRDLAQKRNDFAGYIEHNNEYLRITEETNGKDTATKMATQEAERRIANERELERNERERIAKEREREQQERERERAVLYSTLPKHIADRVIRGEVVNDHIDHAAVMFLDIVGFTTLSGTLTSQQVITLLHTVFGICDEACIANEVTRIKTIGDSYLAVAFPSLVPTSTTFQVPSSKEEIPLVPSSRSELLQVVTSIANAALQIIELVKEIDFKSLQSLQVPSISSMPSSDSESLQLRVGLHCGPVTAGVLGTERLQYDVWGDTVNVASRMESTSEPNRIHVTEQFAELLRNVPGSKFQVPIKEVPSSMFQVPIDATDMERGTRNMELIERGETEIKGKGMMTTYWLS